MAADFEKSTPFIETYTATSPSANAGEAHLSAVADTNFATDVVDEPKRHVRDELSMNPDPRTDKVNPPPVEPVEGCTEWTVTGLVWAKRAPDGPKSMEFTDTSTKHDVGRGNSVGAGGTLQRSAVGDTYSEELERPHILHLRRGESAKASPRTIAKVPPSAGPCRGKTERTRGTWTYTKGTDVPK